MEEEIRVLLIEDSPEEARLLREILNVAGRGRFSVVCVERLSDGLEQLSEGDFSVVVLDLALPDSRGLETFTRLHSHSPAVPVIILSGLADEDVAIEAVRQGAQDYLVKGRAAGELLVRAIRYAIERQRAERSLRESEIRYRTLFQETANPIMVINEQGDYVAGNQAALRFLECTWEELLTKNVRDFVPSGDGVRVLEQHRPLWEKGGTAETEYRVHGEIKVLELTITPATWQGRRVVFGVGKDVTQRRQAERALAWEAEVNAALAKLSKTLLLSVSIDEMSRLVLEEAKRLTGSEFGYVGYVDPETGHLVCPAITGDVWGEHQIPEDRPFVFKEFDGHWGWVIENRQPLLTNSVADHPAFSGTPADHAPVQRFVSAPALVDQEELVGQVALANANRDYTQRDLELVERLATLYAIAIHRSWADQKLQKLNETLEQRVQRRTFELQVLYELSQKIRYIHNYEDLCHLILEHLHRFVGCDVAGTLLITDGRGELFLSRARSTEERVQERIKKRLLQAYEETTGSMVPEEALSVRSFRVETFDSSLPALGKVSSSFHVPILVAGRAMGLIYVGSERERSFDEDDVRMLHTLVAQTADSVQRLQVYLAEEQRRLGQLVENLPEGIVLLNAHNRILLANPTATEILSLIGVGEEETLMRLGSHSMADVIKESSRTVPLTIAIEEPVRGEFEVLSHPIPLDQSEKLGTVIILRDVTKLRKIEDQVHQQDRLAAIGQLAGGIAHDFNNLLTTIILYAQLPLRKPDLPSDLKQVLETILHESQRAADLVRQILDFSRRSSLETQAVDLKPFVKEAVKILRRTLPENIHLATDVREGPYVVRADLTRIQQVLMNLAVNARDVMPQGGYLRIGLARIQVQPGEEPPVADMPPGEWVCLSVSDTGGGIPSDALPHIFEPFFTTKDRGKGTGLGLAQVYGIVKQHGGHIGVTTELGRGTTFEVYLPPHESGAVAQEAPDEGGSVPTGRGETILLVEDEEKIRQLGRDILQSLGYRVLTAANGQEGLEIYRSAGEGSLGQGQAVNLVMTDLVMPRMGGKDLVRELRKSDPHLKALATTGYPLENGLGGPETELFHDVVQKPFDVNTLARAVRKALDMEARP